jgi:hypothetical protein
MEGAARMSTEPNGRPIGRGISNISLVFDGSRWWITGWVDQREDGEHRLPPHYLPPE